MKRWILIGIIIILAGAGFLGWGKYTSLKGGLPVLTEEARVELTAATTAQHEDRIVSPAHSDTRFGPADGDTSLFFGDLHVHTALSFDSYLFGNRIDMDDAYRFARGDQLKTFAGEIMQLSRPLDFVAVTDHAESFGPMLMCASDDLTGEQRQFCDRMDRPSIGFFRQLRREGQERPPRAPEAMCSDFSVCEEAGRTTWDHVRQKAEAYNQPGVFTAFAAYEYSPPLPQSGKVHRNVIFRSSDVPDYAMSAFTALTVVDLWRSLEATCDGACRYLTIPHNMNKTWGLAFGDLTIDGDPFTPDDWALRVRSEPVAEIFQVKGSSECGLGAGTTDEECNFELVVPVCEGVEEAGCSGPNSFMREGLKRGFELQEELGYNPFRLGFIGSTDTHNGNPGDTEEWDWRGTNGVVASPAIKRGVTGGRSFKQSLVRNPGGLAAVWAQENTRGAIFDALQRRETYATTGTRLSLRVFGGYALSGLDLDQPSLAGDASAAGVPMGGVVAGSASEEPFELMVWAGRDAMSSGIHNIQVIKGWIEDGERRETVYPVFCEGDMSEDGACLEAANSVDISDCSYDDTAGAAEVRRVWQDPDFDPNLRAFYYVRVMEMPTCRWSSYDAIRLGVAPPDGVPQTIQERAWSSPIWYEPG